MSARTVVPRPASDSTSSRPSIASPVGKTLVGATPGERRTLETPRGTRTLTVRTVEHS